MVPAFIKEDEDPLLSVHSLESRLGIACSIKYMSGIKDMRGHFTQGAGHSNGMGCATDTLAWIAVVNDSV
jgi:hypothetical protein